MRILLVEDDRSVAAFIQRGLEEEGYAVDVLHDGADAGMQAQSVGYDAAVLDLMLPTRSGFQVLRDIRARKANLPVIMLTAKGSLEDRVTGLDSGADDYMIKPFALAELSARLRALLRRGKPHETQLRVADLEVDVAQRLVSRDGRRIDLKPKEYAVLEYLMRHQGRVMPRTLITEYAWDYHFDPGTNIVDVVITRLRKKIDHGREPKLIHTVRGVGYVVKA